MDKSRESLGQHCRPILGANGRPLLACPDDWDGPLLERKTIPASAECGPQFTGMPVIALGLSGHGKRWYRCGGVTRQLRTEPGGFDIYGATYERDHGLWRGEPGETITVRLPASVLQRYFRDDLRAPDLDTRYNNVDASLRTSLLALAEEIQGGFPTGRLYAEGLSITVVAWLACHYGRGPLESVPMKRGLSARKQARLVEFIESRLDSSLAVSDMAAEFNVSPYYFSRLFRLSFGQSPHKFVLTRRIERAKILLRSTPGQSVADIALQVGFANQAHFSGAFKEMTGKTPSNWRYNE